MTIKIADKVDDLAGYGIEYLTDKDGLVIAMFIDGNMPRACETADASTVTVVN